MEYPIIDTLTDAYIRNGWTGLDFIYGKNLLPPANNDSYSVNGVVVIKNSDNSLTFSGKSTSSTSIGFIDFMLKAGEYKFSIKGSSYIIPRSSYIYLRNLDAQSTIVVFSSNSTEEYQTFTLSEDTKVRFYVVFGDVGLSPTGTLYPMIVKAEETDLNYEPYKQPITDIFSRTRLPLIRYFPHPVIDSLQRAADGTMTADDVQILRHYLTKFGIGNIGLGRFHAINPNLSDDIREINLEPIPIDEPIKKRKPERRI